jgi:hypothetical protein
LDGQPVHLVVPLDATGLDVQRALRRTLGAAKPRGGELRILHGDRALEPHVTLREQGRLVNQTWRDHFGDPWKSKLTSND